MSIAVLTQVYDEMRRLAIAGSVVAGGDFRLKKLIGPLEQAGAKAPVFAKVGQAVKALVESNEQTSSDALLELATLVNAILYTQGETGAPGPLEPIVTTNLGPQTTQTSARMLKPLLEALSETGSGRLEVIKEAFERDAFRDLRLVKPALAALDDPYPEISEFVADKVLPLYGPAILPELKTCFDLKGKAGHLRRLALLHRLDPAGTRDTVKQALENGSKEMKIAAIACLGDSPEDLAFLLEQSTAKSKDVRAAALGALSRVPAAEALDALQKALTGGDLDIAIAPVRENRNPKLLKFVISACEEEQEALLKTKDKKAAGKHAERLLSLLECLRGRDDSATERLLFDLFGRRDALAKVKGEPGGQDVCERVAGLLATGSKGMQKALIDAHATLEPTLLEAAFGAALTSRPPKQLYELFAGYLTAKVDEKKKERDPAWVRRRVICNGIVSNWRLRFDSPDDDGDAPGLAWDDRWLDTAVRIRNLDLIYSLARPGHDGVNTILREELARLQKKDAHERYPVLQMMVRVNHPDAADAVIEAIKKHSKSKSPWGFNWLGLVCGLPKSVIPRFEELIPQLDEKLADGLLESLAILKNEP